LNDNIHFQFHIMEHNIIRSISVYKNQILNKLFTGYIPK